MGGFLSWGVYYGLMGYLNTHLFSAFIMVTQKIVKIPAIRKMVIQFGTNTEKSIFDWCAEDKSISIKPTPKYTPVIQLQMSILSIIFFQGIPFLRDIPPTNSGRKNKNSVTITTISTKLFAIKFITFS